MWSVGPSIVGRVVDRSRPFAVVCFVHGRAERCRLKACGSRDEIVDSLKTLMKLKDKAGKGKSKRAVAVAAVGGQTAVARMASGRKSSPSFISRTSCRAPTELLRLLRLCKAERSVASPEVLSKTRLRTREGALPAKAEFWAFWSQSEERRLGVQGPVWRPLLCFP